jgi:pimeloyl-ACP methyl ester carboxylesterase
MFSVMYPQLQGVDLRREASRLEVPVFILCGDHEIAARTDPAREWFARLEAPTKRWYQLPDAGHSVAFEQADELQRILREDVPAAGPTR